MASSTSAGEKSATKKDTEKASSSSKTQSKSRSSKSSGSSKASASPTASKSARERHEEEVREIQLRNHEDRLVHRPAEVHEDVVVDGRDKDGNPKVEKKGELHVSGGRAFIKVNGEFSQDDLAVFVQQVQKAFQAVQV